MTAIQRWYLHANDGSAYFRHDAQYSREQQKWCRDQDVAMLEAVLAEQSKKHADIVAGLRQQLEKLKAPKCTCWQPFDRSPGPHHKVAYALAVEEMAAGCIALKNDARIPTWPFGLGVYDENELREAQNECKPPTT